MAKNLLLEICVDTLDAAVAAERAGADRIELCEQLPVGGVTPSPALQRAVRASVNIPVFAMVRPRSGDFVYSAEEFARMQSQLALARASGMNGMVLGMLTRERRVDVGRTRILVDMARPLPVTFHRAFDDAANLRHALEDVIATGASRILTSGGKVSSEQGLGQLRELVEAAENRVAILVGGGIHPGNLERMVLETRAREFHSGLSCKLPYPRSNQDEFEIEVGKLAGKLRELKGI